MASRSSRSGFRFDLIYVAGVRHLDGRGRVSRPSRAPRPYPAAVPTPSPQPAADAGANLADWLSAAGSLASAAVAIVLGFIAVYTFRINKRQVTVDERLAAIEDARLHESLRPQFTISLTEQTEDRARLYVKLVGPAAAVDLDSVTVIVGNDDVDHFPDVPGSKGPTEQEVRDQVWGPYRGYADGADPHGRQFAPFPLALGYGRALGLRRTLAPGWSTAETWFGMYDGQPVRLMLVCEAAGYRPWRIVWEGVPEKKKPAA